MELIDQENEDNAEWLLHILKQVQLEQFYVRIRDHLQISRITHFDYVTPDDLEKVRRILLISIAMQIDFFKVLIDFYLILILYLMNCIIF
jgi:activated CDC42 kinase 1